MYSLVWESVSVCSRCSRTCMWFGSQFLYYSRCSSMWFGVQFVVWEPVYSLGVGYYNLLLLLIGCYSYRRRTERQVVENSKTSIRENIPIRR